MILLSIEELSKSFGGFQALHKVNMQVGEGERRAIIGPNGAGKSTFFNVINGQLRPSSGRVRLGSDDVTGFMPHEVWKRGVTRTFQRNNLFMGLSVEQNVRLAVGVHHGQGLRTLFRARTAPQIEEEVAHILERVNLMDHQKTLTGNLAYGEQRQLELAIALAGRPRLLLLDEPTAGMSPAETHAMIDLLLGLPREVTLIIIEHDMDVVFALSDRVTVLHQGEVLVEGAPKEIEHDQRVLEVYLVAR